MTLIEMYNEKLQRDKAVREAASSAKDFVAEIARVANRSESTIRMWLCRLQAPDELTKKTIASHFGVEPEEFFNF